MFKGNTKEVKDSLKKKDKSALNRLIETRKKSMKGSMPSRKAALQEEISLIEKELEDRNKKSYLKPVSKKRRYASDNDDKINYLLFKPDKSPSILPGFDIFNDTPEKIEHVFHPTRRFIHHHPSEHLHCYDEEHAHMRQAQHMKVAYQQDLQLQDDERVHRVEYEGYKVPRIVYKP